MFQPLYNRKVCKGKCYLSKRRINSRMIPQRGKVAEERRGEHSRGGIAGDSVEVGAPRSKTGPVSEGSHGSKHWQAPRGGRVLDNIGKNLRMRKNPKKPKTRGGGENVRKKEKLQGNGEILLDGF